MKRCVCIGVLAVLLAATSAMSVAVGAEGEMPSTTAGDYVIRVWTVTLTDRAATPVGAQRAEAPARERKMTLALELEAPDELAAARICGIEYPLRVVDDRGREVAPLAGDRPRSPILPGRMYGPDGRECTYTLALSLPQQGARSISVEGVLLLFEKCEKVELRFPWGVVGERGAGAGVEAVTKQFGEREQALQATLAVTRPDMELPLAAPLWASMTDEDTWVVWEDGQQTKNHRLTGNEEGYTFEFGRALSQKGAADELVYTTIVKARPTVRVPFRVAGIPVPEGPRRTAEEGAVEPQPHPFWVPDERAGSIEFDVMVGDKPMPGPISIRIAMAYQQDEERASDWEHFWAEIDKNGHVTLSHLRPGQYGLIAVGNLIGDLHAHELRRRLGRVLEIDAQDYTWMDEFQHPFVRRGQTTELRPVRFVPEMQALTPAPDATVPRSQVVFSWEPYPGAASYTVSLSVRLSKRKTRRFWLSNPVGETQLRYAPDAGQSLAEGDAEYLTLRPGTKYSWAVAAFDQDGVKLSQAHGGTFEVE